MGCRGEVAVGAAHSEGRGNHRGRDGAGENNSAGRVPCWLAPQQQVQGQSHCVSCHCNATVAEGIEAVVPHLPCGRPA